MEPTPHLPSHNRHLWIPFIAVILWAALAVCIYQVGKNWSEKLLSNTPRTAAEKHPTDDALIAHFNAHRDHFESLLKMFQEDVALGRVAMNFTRPEDPGKVGVSPARIADYRSRFRQLRLPHGIEGYEAKDKIWLHASAFGLSITGTSKGYAYLKTKPGLVVDNLDEYEPPRDKGSHVVFRQLEGDWYLYYDITY